MGMGFELEGLFESGGADPEEACMLMMKWGCAVLTRGAPDDGGHDMGMGFECRTEINRTLKRNTYL